MQREAKDGVPLEYSVLKNRWFELLPKIGQFLRMYQERRKKHEIESRFMRRSSVGQYTVEIYSHVNFSSHKYSIKSDKFGVLKRVYPFLLSNSRINKAKA